MTLSVLQWFNYLFPLIMIPYLTRTLGPMNWGILSIIQSYVIYLNILIEYGFTLSATREVAKVREDKDRVAELIGSVLGGQLILVCLSILLTFFIWLLFPVFHRHPLLVTFGLLWSIAQSLNLIWLYQGLEKLQFISIVDICFKVLVLISIFIFVKKPEDIEKVLLIQGMGSFATLAVTIFVTWRIYKFRLPSLGDCLVTLKLGWSMFLFRSAVSLYTVANVLILGVFASPAIVGYYAAAEKIAKAITSLINPITSALFPRFSYLVNQSREKAFKLAKISFIGIVSASFILALIVFIFAPLIITSLLGSGFSDSINILRILCILIPVIAISNVLGIQWMIPLGLDNQFNKIILSAGIVNVLLAFLLTPKYLHFGMAYTVVVTELFVTGTIFLILKSRGLNPLIYKGE